MIDLFQSRAYRPIVQSAYISGEIVNKTFEEIFPNITLRKHQKQALEGINSHMFSVLLYHRRGGKDTIAWLWMIYRAITMPNTSHQYFFPYRSLASLVMENSRGTIGSSMIALVPREYLSKEYSKSEKVLNFKNGSTILIKGLDKELTVGSEAVSFVFSELASSKNQEAHEYVSYIWEASAVRDKVKIVYASTPRGRNFFYDITEGIRKEGGFYHKVTIEDSGLVSSETLADMRARGKNEDQIQQELFCSFVEVKADKIYQNELDAASYELRFNRINVNILSMVSTAWDLGIRGDTVIILFTTSFNNVGDLEIKIIDTITDRDKGIAFYVNELVKRDYNYEWHFLPHDSTIRDKVTTKSYMEGLREALAKVQKVRKYSAGRPSLLKRDGVISGIRLVREYFTYMHFNGVFTEKLVNNLYMYKWTDRTRDGEALEEPCHDKYSHSADALRYLVQGLVSKGMHRNRELNSGHNVSFDNPRRRWNFQE